VPEPTACPAVYEGVKENEENHEKILTPRGKFIRVHSNAPLIGTTNRVMANAQYTMASPRFFLAGTKARRVSLSKQFEAGESRSRFGAVTIRRY
jgi:hypothetical protein